MKLSKITEIIENAFPKERAYEWDNIGLLVGDKNRDIKRILVTLDITKRVIDEAIREEVGLILSHHPIMFGGIKSITTETDEGNILLSAIQNDIAVYAAHTNCDVADFGINAYLARLFELENITSLEETGLGRIGTLKQSVTLRKFAENVKGKLNTPYVRLCGNLNRQINTVAIGSGACADSIPTAIEKGADVMLTADMKYHEMLNAEASGICVIDAGHYPTEIVVMDIFGKLLSGEDVEIVKSQNTDIFQYV